MSAFFLGVYNNLSQTAAKEVSKEILNKETISVIKDYTRQLIDLIRWPAWDASVVLPYFRPFRGLVKPFVRLVKISGAMSAVLTFLWIYRRSMQRLGDRALKLLPKADGVQPLVPLPVEELMTHANGRPVERVVDTQLLRNTLQEMAFEPTHGDKSNSHYAQAAHRLAATHLLDNLSVRLGLSRFTIAPSRTELARGEQHVRPNMDVKDGVSYDEFTCTDLAGAEFLKLVDVDYHMSEEQLQMCVESGIVAMYTYALTAVASDVEGLAHRYNTITRKWQFQTAVGAYEHELWDWTGEARTLIHVPGVPAWCALACSAVVALSSRYSWRLSILALIGSGIGAVARLLPQSTEVKVVRRDLGCHRAIVVLVPMRRYSVLETIWRWKLVRANRMRRIIPACGVIEDGERIVAMQVYGERPYKSLAMEGHFRATTMTAEAEAVITVGHQLAKSSWTGGHALAQFRSHEPPIEATATDAKVMMAGYRSNVLSLTLPVLTEIVAEQRAVRNFLPFGASDLGRKEGEHRWMIQRPVMPCILEGAAFVPARGGESEMHMYLIRIANARNPIIMSRSDEMYQNEFCDLFAHFAHEAGLQYLQLADEHDMREKQSRPTQQHIIDEGADGAGRPGKQAANAHTKNESYSTIGASRTITAPADGATKIRGAQLEYGFVPFVKAQPWYGPSLNPAELDEKLGAISRGSQHIAITDLSNCDGTVGPKQRILRKKLRMRISRPTDRKYISEVCDEVWDNNVYLESIEYSQFYAQGSGMPDTSTGNTPDCAYSSFAAWRRLGVPPLEAYKKVGLFVGDDGYVPDGDPAALLQSFQIDGRDLKIKLYKRCDRAVIPFTGRLYGPEMFEGEANSMADVLRRLKSIHLTRLPEGRFTDVVIRKTISDCLFATDAATPILGPLARKLQALCGDTEPTPEAVWYSARAALEAKTMRPRNQRRDWMDEHVHKELGGYEEAVDKFLAWCDGTAPIEALPTIKYVEVTIKPNTGDFLVDGELHLGEPVPEPEASVEARVQRALDAGHEPDQKIHALNVHKYGRGSQARAKEIDANFKAVAARESGNIGVCACGVEIDLVKNPRAKVCKACYARNSVEKHCEVCRTKFKTMNEAYTKCRACTKRGSVPLPGKTTGEAEAPRVELMKTPVQPAEKSAKAAGKMPVNADAASVPMYTKCATCDSKILTSTGKSQCQLCMMGVDPQYSGPKGPNRKCACGQDIWRATKDKCGHCLEQQYVAAPVDMPAAAPRLTAQQYGEKYKMRDCERCQGTFLPEGDEQTCLACVDQRKKRRKVRVRVNRPETNTGCGLCDGQGRAECVCAPAERD